MIHFLHNLNTHIVFKRLFIFYQSFPKKSIYHLYSVTAINRASSRWCCCSITQLCLTLCDPMNLQHTRLPCPSPSPRVCSTYAHWVSDAIQPSHPLSPPSLPALNLSQNQGLFQRWALRIRWLKSCSFSSSIGLSNEYSELIFFRINWFNILAVRLQWTYLDT